MTEASDGRAAAADPESKKTPLINSDVPAGLNDAEVLKRKLAWKKRVKRAEEREKGYLALVCGRCGELLHIAKDSMRCKNNCEPGEDPIPRRFHYPEYFGSFNDFCLAKDDHGDILIFKPAVAAKWYRTNFLFMTDRQTKILYYYDPDSHRWSKDGETFLHQLLAQAMDKEYAEHHYTNVLDALKATTYDDILFSEKVAVENGLLNVETGELSDFTPNEMPFYSIPDKYDPAVRSSLWLNFVSQVVDQDDSKLMQEWSGYTLLPRYPKHKFAFIYGTGRNGKGVWDRTLQGILGSDNCVTLRLEELNGDRRFSLARCYGKLYCSCPEPLVNKELQTPILKSITGEDVQNAELKCKQETLHFTNVAKITVFGNRYPRVNDDSDAFYERLEILEFPNQFLGENQKDDIEQIWLNDPKERSGILNWMIEGLQRLLAKGSFTTSKTQKQKVLELKKISDPFNAFIEEHVKFVPKAVITRAELYDAFVAYCDEIGAKTDSNPKFTQNMQKLTRVKSTVKKIEGKSARVWEGIALKIENEVEQTTLSTVSTPLPNRKIQMSSSILEVEDHPKSVETVETESNTEDRNFRTCGKCSNFHLPSCQYPGSFEKVAFDSSWAVECHGFTNESIVKPKAAAHNQPSDYPEPGEGMEGF